MQAPISGRCPWPFRQWNEGLRFRTRVHLVRQPESFRPLGIRSARPVLFRCLLQGRCDTQQGRDVVLAERIHTLQAPVQGIAARTQCLERLL